MLNSHVLVLNRLYQPVHVTSVKRGLSLLYQGVARAIDNQYRLYEFSDWAQLSSANHDSVGTITRRIRIPRVLVFPVEHLRTGQRHLPVLRPPVGALGVELGSRVAALPGRKDQMGKCGLLVLALQSEEGRAHPAPGGDEVAQKAGASSLDSLLPKSGEADHLPRVAALLERGRGLLLECGTPRRMKLQSGTPLPLLHLGFAVSAGAGSSRWVGERAALARRW